MKYIRSLERPSVPRRRECFYVSSKGNRTTFPSLHSGPTEPRLSVRRDHENKTHEKMENWASVSTEYYEYSQRNQYS